MVTKLIVVIIIIIFLTFFIAENINEKVALSFLGYDIKDIPAVVLMLVSVLVGVLLTLPIFMKQKIEHFKRIRFQKKRIKKLKKNKDQAPKLLTHDN